MVAAVIVAGAPLIVAETVGCDSVYREACVPDKVMPETEMDLLTPTAGLEKIAEYDDVEKLTLSEPTTPDNWAAEKFTVAVEVPL